MLDKDGCLGLLDFLKSKHGHLYGYFDGPAMAVLAPSMQATYQSLVPNPRDLSMIRMKVQQEIYDTVEDFGEDITLCLDNAKNFCNHYPEFKAVHEGAETLSKVFEKKMAAFLKAGLNESSGKGKLVGKAKGNKGRASTGSIQKKDGRASARVHNKALQQQQTLIDGMEQQLHDKVIRPLKTESGASLLLNPVLPSASYHAHYVARIPDPMDLSTLTARLVPAPTGEGGMSSPSAAIEIQPKYATVEQCVTDARRIFSNAIRYNCHQDKASAQIRRSVSSVLFKFETKLLDWNKKTFPDEELAPPLPQLRAALAAIEHALKVRPSDPNVPEGTGAVIAFVDPVIVQLDAQTYKAYLKEVPRPMDYGTIIESLLGGRYGTLEEFVNDCRQVAFNCETYWRSRPDGTFYIQDANNLLNAVLTALADVRSHALMPILPAPQAAPAQTLTLPARRSTGGGGGGRQTLKIDRSSKGNSDKANKQGANNACIEAEAPPQPAPVYSSLQVNNYYLQPAPASLNESRLQLERRALKYLQALFLALLEVELPKHYLKSRLPGAEEMKIFTALPFVQRVDPRMIPEYHKWLAVEGREEQYIQALTRKVRSGQYGTSVCEVLKDMETLHDNAHAFNQGAENVEIRIMADCVKNYFHYLVKQCMSALLHCSDTPLKEFLLTREVMSILDQRTSEDVVAYLNLVELDREQAEESKRKEEEARRAEAEKQAAELLAMEEQAAFMDPFQLQQGMGFDTGGFYDEFTGEFMQAPQSAPLLGGLRLSLGGSGSKGKKQQQQMMQQVYMPVHEKAEWEQAATVVLNKICRHVYVDGSRGGKNFIADFFNPVSRSFPHLAEEYLENVKQPYDLSILTDELNNGLLLDPEDFLEKLCRVFKNLVIYNQRPGLEEHQERFSKEMVAKGNHLADYCKWLCLENLPLKSQAMEDKEERPEMLGELRASVNLFERKNREAIIFDARPLPQLLDCRKLLQSLKRTKSKAEAIVMSWFCEAPFQPSDYSVYVRRPMDLGTILRRFEKGTPELGGYHTYGQVLGDIRLTFQNSIKYNSVHLADEGSARVHQAASEILQKFEDLVPTFSIETAERANRDRISNQNYTRMQQAQQSRLAAEQKDLAAFHEQEKSKRLAEDAAFREDMDVELKKKRTHAEQHAWEAQQQKLRIEAAEAAAELGFDDHESNHLGEEAALMQQKLNVERARVLLQGAGPLGVAPSHMLPFTQQLRDVREATWAAFLPRRVCGNMNMQTGSAYGQNISPAAESKDGAGFGGAAVMEESGSLAGARARAKGEWTVLPQSADASASSSSSADNDNDNAMDVVASGVRVMLDLGHSVEIACGASAVRHALKPVSGFS